jgi:hypothetical protein
LGLEYPIEFVSRSPEGEFQARGKVDFGLNLALRKNKFVLTKFKMPKILEYECKSSCEEIHNFILSDFSDQFLDFKKTDPFDAPAPLNKLMGLYLLYNDL